MFFFIQAQRRALMQALVPEIDGVARQNRENRADDAQDRCQVGGRVVVLNCRPKRHIAEVEQKQDQEQEWEWEALLYMFMN